MDIKSKIENLIKDAILSLYKRQEIADLVVLEHPNDINNGDYSFPAIKIIQTHLGTQRKVEREHPDAIKIIGTPMDAPLLESEKIRNKILENKPDYIQDIQIAGAGFINFYLSREFFTNATKEILKQKDNWGKNNLSSGKKVMVEYTDPNPFKPFHIGHLMTNAIGESIARIFEYSGATTIRANYQGDIGPHVAKAIYGMEKASPLADESASPAILAQYIGDCYAKGSDAYDNNPEAKKEIEEINKKVYDKTDSEINKIYDWGRKVTLDAFEEIYTILGTKFDYYFFESDMAPIGEKVVRENIGKVFTESDGAIVFHGEEHDVKLHTRVFINSHGLPTYETKEIGLTMTKFEKENPDLSIVITAIEQAEYMKVVQKAISLIHPDYEKRMKHITHGMMKFASGKMSSRKGNIITGESLLRDSISKVVSIMNQSRLGMKTLVFSPDEEKLNEGILEINKICKQVGVSAVKYSILRSSLTGDIVYDFEKSISFEGDSGPYLQYTAVRANGISKKAEAESISTGFSDVPEEVTNLEHLLYQFPEIIARAYEQLEPHHIATYLTELASAFNSFYANTVIVNTNDPYAPYRVALVEAFYLTMKNGLYLLGIETPNKM